MCNIFKRIDKLIDKLFPMVKDGKDHYGNYVKITSRPDYSSLFVLLHCSNGNEYVIDWERLHGEYSLVLYANNIYSYPSRLNLDLDYEERKRIIELAVRLFKNGGINVDVSWE